MKSTKSSEEEHYAFNNTTTPPQQSSGYKGVFMESIRSTQVICSKDLILIAQNKCPCLNKTRLD